MFKSRHPDQTESGRILRSDSFQSLFVCFPAAYPVASVFLLLVYPILAGFTRFRLVGIQDESRPTYCAPLCAVPRANLRFQRLVQRQDRPEEPLTADRKSNHLRTGAGVAVVQRKAVAVLLEKASCLIPAACSGVGTLTQLRDNLSRSLILVTVSRTGGTVHFPCQGIPFQTYILF